MAFFLLFTASARQCWLHLITGYNYCPIFKFCRRSIWLFWWIWFRFGLACARLCFCLVCRVCRVWRSCLWGWLLGICWFYFRLIFGGRWIGLFWCCLSWLVYWSICLRIGSRRLWIRRDPVINWRWLWGRIRRGKLRYWYWGSWNWWNFRSYWNRFRWYLWRNSLRLLSFRSYWNRLSRWAFWCSRVLCWILSLRLV